jgi:Bacterial Ig domain
MRRPAPRLRLLLLLGAVALLAAACGGGGGLGGYGDDGTAAAGGAGMTIGIVSPAAGAEVTQPFTLEVDASVPLGAPDTGRHHVHVWFDGKEADYKINYTDTFRVEGLPAGEHVITAALANADHSLAGPRSQVTVTVAGGDGGQTATSGGQGGGYGSP